MNEESPSDKKLEDFINRLTSKGYNVQPGPKKPQIYIIDGKPVNIRCRGKSKTIADGRGFWYSVSFNVLREVKGVVYITTGPDYLFMFPSNFLESLKDRMYQDKSKAGVGIFDLDWDKQEMILKGNPEPISEYYCNLVYQYDFPDIDSL